MDTGVTEAVSDKPLRQKSSIIASFPWQTSVLDVADLASIFKEKNFKVLTGLKISFNTF
jgi:hypothetical protein